MQRKKPGAAGGVYARGEVPFFLIQFVSQVIFLILIPKIFIIFIITNTAIKSARVCPRSRIRACSQGGADCSFDVPHRCSIRTEVARFVSASNQRSYGFTIAAPQLANVLAAWRSE